MENLWGGRGRRRRGERRGCRLRGEGHESVLIVQLVDIPFALHVRDDEVDLPICKCEAESRHVNRLVEIAPVFDDVDEVLLRILPCAARLIERGREVRAVL